jgi:hypothetical protein
MDNEKLREIDRKLRDLVKIVPIRMRCLDRAVEALTAIKDGVGTDADSKRIAIVVLDYIKLNETLAEKIANETK